MLTLYQSNRLEALVTLLATQIQFPASDNALAPETILVHSPGMSQWLKLQIAEQNGIAANIDFPLPSSFIWRLYQHLLPDVPAQSPFNKDRMTWKLYQLLPQHLDKPEFKSINDYLNTEKPISVDSELETRLANLSDLSATPVVTADSASTETYESKAYNSNELTSYEQLRLFQLAEKVADVFDNYLMYRPHWLKHWQQGHTDLPGEETAMGDDIKGQQWQSILWQALVEFTDQQQQSPLHRASMHKLLLEKLAGISTEQLKAALPKPLHRLFIFGISSLPTHQLEVLTALSEHIDVQILWLNPCSQYWGDILSDKTIARLNSKQQELAQLNINHKEDYFVTGNPLLASWGKVGRDYLDVLTNSDIQIHDVFIDASTDTSAGFTSLEKVQNDILNLEYRGEQMPLSPEQINSDFGKVLLNKDDDSILIHNCHSRIRELEVLKDKLLGWIEQDPTLLPKDILVMVPDVNQYAPFIESVFKSVDTKSAGKPFDKQKSQHNQNIPFTISDRGGLEENPLLNTFVDLLLLPSSRFTVSELFDHLEVPAVMATFKLSQGDINLIKQWIEQSQIKWAKDAKHKTKWQLPEIDLNTWVYGLKRMVLGVSLGEQGLWNNILAYQKIEGLNQAILGKLLNYFSFISELEQILSGDKSIEQWTELLEQFVTHLFTLADFTSNANGQDGEHQTEYQKKLDEITIQKIRNAIAQLTVYLDDRDFTGKFNYHLVHHFFAQHLSESGVAQRFLAGRMNFCTLMPMRSVPFKVICILGLNDGDYPRHVDPISFDLVGLNNPRKGDRSPKLDERYLFLEAVSSARNKLHLSFIGQSVKNNQSLMPSVILSELIDYIQQSFIVDNTKDKGFLADQVLDRVMIKHKLQPFNQEYFLVANQNKPYKSYSKRWFDVCETQNSVKNNSTVSDHYGQTIDSVGIGEDHFDRPQDRQDLKIDQLDRKNSPEDPIKDLDDPFNGQVGSKFDLSNINTNINNDLKINKAQIDLGDLIEFWRHPIKYYYRRVLDIKLDFNNDALSDHEVFQHDGLQKYTNQSALLEQLLFSDASDTDQNNQFNNDKSLRSGNYPAKKWGESVIHSYQKQSLDMVNLVKDLLNLDPSESFKQQTKLVKKQHIIEIELPSLTTEHSVSSVNLQATIEKFEFGNANSSSSSTMSQKRQQASVFVRSGKIRSSDKLSAWLTHLSKCAAFDGSTTVLIGNDNTLGWFEPITPQQAQQALSLWVSVFVQYKQQNRMLKWHCDPAFDWFKEKQAGASELSLQNTITKHIAPSTFSLSARNLTDDEYAAKHLRKLEDFDDSFYQLTEASLAELFDQYQEGKANKVLSDVKSALVVGSEANSSRTSSQGAE
ncbi:exodeoxyribonuclease V subunit gamma [uncultured Psychrosphaera sp.]|uniref:exodeoxyribonuclease V subunit gamma n=1 Tax=uncultured Psychrosphaera sp. TaxID=1403522 RepID=UPI002631DD22|nr:exodeoxyribonuclease V subunit gamma [uncultured Psychrosphaera sp.]